MNKAIKKSIGRSMKKSFHFKSILILLLFSLNVFAVGGPFLKAIGEKALSVVLKKSFNPSDVKFAAKSIELALKSMHGIVPKDNKIVIDNLKELAKDIRNTANAQKALVLFESDSLEKLSKTQLKEGIDALLFLAGEKGTHLPIVRQCAVCARADSVFKYALHVLDNGTMKEAMKEINKQYAHLNERAIRKEIRSLLKSTQSSLKYVDDIDKDNLKTAFLFLKLTESKYDQFPEIRAFTEGVFAVSKDSKGKVVLFDSKNGKAWKLLESNPDANMLQKMGKLYKLTARYSSRYNLSKEDAFYKVLTKKAGDDPTLQGYVKTLKEQNCYFK